jgi:hypothetical protein
MIAARLAVAEAESSTGYCPSHGLSVEDAGRRSVRASKELSGLSTKDVSEACLVSGQERPLQRLVAIAGAAFASP